MIQTATYASHMKMGLKKYLFLFGVLFICDGLHVLGPSDPLTVQLGGSVMLPCYVEAPIPLEELEVEWRKTDSKTLVHLFQDGESRPEAQNEVYSGRASFFTGEVERGNFSLLLTNLNPQDAGVYNCSVYRQQDTGQTSVEVKDIERLIVTGGHVVSVYAGEDITLNCSVDSSIPPEKLEEVSWKKVDPLIPVLIFQEGVVQTESTHERYRDRVEFFSLEEIQKGNFSLRLKDLRTEDKGQYMCEVFSGELAANTTVEVQQLGFSSVHKAILVLCMLALVVSVALIYPACTSLKNNDYIRRLLAIQCMLVCCPNIAVCLAFILWGVIEGFFTEAAICSALNLLRILSLFWIAPYLDTFKKNLQQFIKGSTITLEYVVIATFSYPGLLKLLWRIYQENQAFAVLFPAIILLLLLLLLCICGFIKGLKPPPLKGKWIYLVTEFVNLARGFAVVASFVSNIGNIVLMFLPILPVFFSLVILDVNRRSSGLFNRRSKFLIWILTMLISEVLSASSSVYIHYVSLDTLEAYKDRAGLTCVTVYLYVLTGMVLFEVLIYVYGCLERRLRSNRSQQSQRVNSALTVAQQTKGQAIVYMLGAVGLTVVNSVALTVELILKARNGERTVEDLRVILLPFECIFALCCLVTQILMFYRTNREELKADLKDLRKLCGCKQVSENSPTQNHELQALQSAVAAPASQESAS